MRQRGTLMDLLVRLALISLWDARHGEGVSYLVRKSVGEDREIRIVGVPAIQEMG